MNLSQIDINLLVALDALLTERQVTRAAQRLNISQPAMSQALRRLRTQFNDPLLVRSRTGMEPTPRAAAMALHLRRTLAQLQSVIEEKPAFDPTTSHSRFSIASLDYVSVILPPLMAKLSEEAPGVNVDVKPLIQQENMWEILEEGEAEIGIGFCSQKLVHVKQEVLFEESFISLVRPEHPILRGEISLEEFAAWPHGLFSSRGHGKGAIDDALEKAGLQRRIAVRIPYFLAVPALLQSTELLFTLPRRIADYLLQHYELVAFEPPLPTPTFPISMLWPVRLDFEEGNRWLREKLREVVRESTSERSCEEEGELEENV